jgi:hypothetical protein
MSSHESGEDCKSGDNQQPLKKKSTKKAILEQQRKEKLAIKRAKKKARRLANRQINYDMFFGLMTKRL